MRLTGRGYGIFSYAVSLLGGRLERFCQLATVLVICVVAEELVEFRARGRAIALSRASQSHSIMNASRISAIRPGQPEVFQRFVVSRLLVGQHAPIEGGQSQVRLKFQGSVEVLPRQLEAASPKVGERSIVITPSCLGRQRQAHGKRGRRFIVTPVFEGRSSMVEIRPQALGILLYRGLK